jgi:hypothetical protein
MAEVLAKSAAETAEELEAAEASASATSTWRAIVVAGALAILFGAVLAFVITRTVTRSVAVVLERLTMLEQNTRARA